MGIDEADKQLTADELQAVFAADENDPGHTMTDSKTGEVFKVRDLLVQLVRAGTIVAFQAEDGEVRYMNAEPAGSA
jgi:hypothetical protein